MALLWDYLRRRKREVAGWLQRVDAEMIGSLLDYQTTHAKHANCVEIGLHHGKSFIPLCMSLRGSEKALGIDLFEEQDRNLDMSGKGDLQSLKHNLRTFHINESSVHLHRGSSEDVSGQDILNMVGPVRFFSIDGGHWCEIVQNDLRLAESTLTDDGVVSLDDYCRAEWPDVTYGHSLWQETTSSDIVPFAIGSNKLYLCRKPFAAVYRDALQSPFLKDFAGKSTAIRGHKCDCYRTECHEQDESSLRQAIVYSLKSMRPDYFRSLKPRR